MKIAELVAAVKTQSPALAGKMEDKALERLLRAALVQIRSTVEQSSESLVIEGLGRFNVRQVEREVEGEKKSVRRVVYVAPKPKVKPEGEAVAAPAGE